MQLRSGLLLLAPMWIVQGLLRRSHTGLTCIVFGCAFLIEFFSGPCGTAQGLPSNKTPHSTQAGAP